MEVHVKQCLCFVLDEAINLYAAIPFAVVGGRRDPAGACGAPSTEAHLGRVLINRIARQSALLQTTCASERSGDLPTPSPPAEKATARQDQAGKASNLPSALTRASICARCFRSLVTDCLEFRTSPCPRGRYI